MKVVIYPFDNCYIAQAEQRSMWCLGKTPEDAIEQFKKEYGALPIEYKFETREKMAES